MSERLVRIVTVTEGIRLQMAPAFLAGATRNAGFVPSRLATDFCTEEDAFQAAVADPAPTAVLFPYHPEFRDIIAHLSAVARRAVDGPVAVIGPELSRDPEAPRFEDGVLAIPDDPGATLPAALHGEEWSPSVEDTAARFGFYGGATLLDDPGVASLFGELGTAGLVAGRAALDELPPTAHLARLEAPIAGPRLTLAGSVALAPLDGLGDRLERVEWWDRHADAGVRARVEELAARGVRQSVRLLPERITAGELEELKTLGVDRVVFEVDRLEEGARHPDTAACVAEIAPHATRARELGLEVGVLLVVGLPGEDRAANRLRIQRLRELAPDHLRCLAFEAVPGTKLAAHLDREGQLPPRGWNRELYRPLRRAGFSTEEFIENWSDALLLLAEIETCHSMLP